MTSFPCHPCPYPSYQVVKKSKSITDDIKQLLLQRFVCSVSSREKGGEAGDRVGTRGLGVGGTGRRTRAAAQFEKQYLVGGLSVCGCAPCGLWRRGGEVGWGGVGRLRPGGEHRAAAQQWQLRLLDGLRCVRMGVAALRQPSSQGNCNQNHSPAGAVLARHRKATEAIITQLQALTVGGRAGLPA